MQQLMAIASAMAARSRMAGVVAGSGSGQPARTVQTDDLLRAAQGKPPFSMVAACAIPLQCN